MEKPGGGILGRLGEKTLGWIILGGLIFLGIAIYQTPAATKAAIWSGIWRTVVWVALVAGVPWIARLFIARILEAGTNWAGVALLAALLAVDVILAMLLMTGWPSGVWAWLVALAALGVVGTYNYLVTAYLAEMSGP